MNQIDQQDQIDALERGLATAQIAVSGLAARVESLEQRIRQTDTVGAVQIAGTQSDRNADRSTGKYAALTEWLDTQTRSEVAATFEDVERVLGFSLPDSAFKHQPYWQGLPNPLARSVLAAGWRVTELRMAAKTLVFRRD